MRSRNRLRTFWSSEALSRHGEFRRELVSPGAPLSVCPVLGKADETADIANSTLMPSRPGEFHPESLTEPDLILSHHPARAIARRLPPSAESSGSSRILPSWPMLNGDDPPPSLRGHYPASSLLRGSPPLSGASVLSASRLEPLALFPLASPARFSRSVPEPD